MPLDDDFRAFQSQYPKHRRTGGHLAEAFFFEAANSAGSSAVLFAAMAQHAKSAEWKRGFVPSMTTWLKDELWRRELPEGEAVKPAGPAWLHD